MLGPLRILQLRSGSWLMRNGIANRRRKEVVLNITSRVVEVTASDCGSVVADTVNMIPYNMLISLMKFISQGALRRQDVAWNPVSSWILWTEFTKTESLTLNCQDHTGTSCCIFCFSWCSCTVLNRSGLTISNREWGPLPKRNSAGGNPVEWWSERCWWNRNLFTVIPAKIRLTNFSSNNF